MRLTPEGTRRRLGQRATVAWHPEQGVVGAIVVAVTGLERVPLSRFHDFLLDARTKRSTPYFVHATVSNVGRRGLGGYAVPLYLLDRTGALIQASSFRASFASCPSGPLPVTFPHGTRTPVCLVYFAPRHGSAAGVTFRPSQDFEAITWKPAPKATGNH